jgi:hypothetical protein
VEGEAGNGELEPVPWPIAYETFLVERVEPNQHAVKLKTPQNHMASKGNKSGSQHRDGSLAPSDLRVTIALC